MGTQSGSNCHEHSQRKKFPVDSCEIATARKLKKWDYLEKISKELGENANISVDLLIDANCLEAP